MKRTPLKKISKKRLAKLGRVPFSTISGARKPIRNKGRSRFPKRRSPEYKAWFMDTVPFHCYVGYDSEDEFAVFECDGPSEAMHVQTRGAGGSDIGNLVKGCRYHHARQHTLGIRSFERRYGVQLKVEAEYWGQLYRERHDV